MRNHWFKGTVLGCGLVVFSGCGAWETIVVDTAQEAAQAAVEQVVTEIISGAVEQVADELLGDLVPGDEE